MSNTTPQDVAFLKIYSQNVYKKYDYLSVLLEDLRDSFDIIFVQEPPWVTLRHTASMTEREGAPVTGPPLHLAWMPYLGTREVRDPMLLLM